MRKLDDGPARSFGSSHEAYSPGKRLITSKILCWELSEITAWQITNDHSDILTNPPVNNEEPV